MAPVVIDHLIFDVYLMGIRLSDHDQRSFGFRGRPLFDPVIARNVSRIGPREVWRLDPAQFSVALVEYSVAVASRYHLSPPRLERAVTVPEVRVAFPQILVRQFEIEIVTDTLETRASRNKYRR